MPKRGRSKPVALEKTEALLSRLKSNHPKWPEIRLKMKDYQKGFDGERKLDYYLQSLPRQFAILNDITLAMFGKQFQIDSLLISAHAIFIIEAKNIDGPVTFDTVHHQFTKEDGKTLRGYKHPIVQVETIHHHLENWLQARNLAGLPIFHFIAFAERSTIFHVTGDEEAIRKVVSYADAIPLLVMKHEEYVAANHSGNNRLKNKIIQAIMREAEEFDYDALQKFGIAKEEILPGVHCPKCRTLGMQCRHGKGCCLKCGAHSKHAYVRSLYEYTLLVDEKITNKACRNFLQLTSRHVALYKIQQSGLFVKKDAKTWVRK